ncbi:hypothetical protein NC651_004701 [Populus alba x Populus x berolinensis]|nr:hypothetical protein NC651_004701 [Populus alba x Populus x berolinensis]
MSNAGITSKAGNWITEEPKWLVMGRCPTTCIDYCTEILQANCFELGPEREPVDLRRKSNDLRLSYLSCNLLYFPKRSPPFAFVASIKNNTNNNMSSSFSHSNRGGRGSEMQNDREGSRGRGRGRGGSSKDKIDALGRLLIKLTYLDVSKTVMTEIDEWNLPRMTVESESLVKSNSFQLRGNFSYETGNTRVILTEVFDGTVPVKYFERIESWPDRRPIPFQDDLNLIVGGPPFDPYRMVV